MSETSFYPDEGELFKAKQKRSDALIFFVHFYKGHKKVLRRHVELVNELGFDAYVYNLRDDLKEHFYLPYSPVSRKFGMKHALADQIEEHLDLHPNYTKKIIFAFSNVAGSAIEVMARRKPLDILALICDSGPGANILRSSYNLMKEQFKINFLPLRLAVTAPFTAGWSQEFHKDIPEDLKLLPEGYPVLSIRGWKDPLITPRDIDTLFDSCANLSWTKLALPDAAHLDGLKTAFNEYRSGVENFLRPYLN